MKILFIGNSYTYYNDMPKLLEALLIENGYDAKIDSVTKGGRKLFANLEAGDEYNAQILELVSKNSYDALFLQEQSYFPLVDHDKFENAVKALKELVGAERTILYATWGRKAGCPLLDELKLSSAEMTDALTEVYTRAASALGCELSPVGSAFKSIGDKLELYNTDLSHPSFIGSALAAIVHYKSLIGALPQKISSLGIDKDVGDTVISSL